MGTATHPAERDPHKGSPYDRTAVDGAELRASLIASGALVPGRADGLTPLRLLWPPTGSGPTFTEIAEDL